MKRCDGRSTCITALQALFEESRGCPHNGVVTVERLQDEGLGENNVRVRCACRHAFEYHLACDNRPGTQATDAFQLYRDEHMAAHPDP